MPFLGLPSKTLTNFAWSAFISLLAFLPHPASALGGKDSGGGDIKAVQQAVHEKRRVETIHALELLLLSTDFQNQLLSIEMLAGEITDPEAQKIIKDMINRGLVDDMGQSRISLSSECLADVNGVPTRRSASALMNKPGTRICVSPIDIVDDLGLDFHFSHLVGLMIHEFAHHYGYEDADHKVAAAVSEVYQSSLEKVESQTREPVGSLLSLYRHKVRRMLQESTNSDWIEKLNACARREWNCYYPVGDD